MVSLLEQSTTFPTSVINALNSLEEKKQKRFKKLAVPMQPSEFCAFWVPKFYNKSPGDSRYNIEAIALLKSITGVKRSTLYNYLSDGAPLSICLLLRAIHVNWVVLFKPQKNGN